MEKIVNNELNLLLNTQKPKAPIAVPVQASSLAAPATVIENKMQQLVIKSATNTAIDITNQLQNCQASITCISTLQANRDQLINENTHKIDTLITQSMSTIHQNPLLVQTECGNKLNYPINLTTKYSPPIPSPPSNINSNVAEGKKCTYYKQK